MRNIFLILMTFIISGKVLAQEFYFKPDDYLKGLHLMAGGGINGSIYNSDVERQNQGFGLNLKTDLGYYFNDRFAIEWSSNVKFNKVKEYLIWDTLITGGIRYRFEDFPFTDSNKIYMRLFYGKAPTVFFIDDAPEVYRRSSAKRLQYDGPVYGFAFGEMYETKKGRVWFLEYGASMQELRELNFVRNEGEVPTVLFSETSRGAQVKIYSLYASIGVLVF